MAKQCGLLLGTAIDGLHEVTMYGVIDRQRHYVDLPSNEMCDGNKCIDGHHELAIYGTAGMRPRRYKSTTNGTCSDLAALFLACSPRRS